MVRLALFVATEKGFQVLKHLYQVDRDVIGLVSTFKEVNVKEDYSQKIADFCKEQKLDFAYWTDLKTCLEKNLVEHGITEIIAIGWRYLIPLSINTVLRNGLIVFHDSLLPRFRGFAPTPTAIICGETEIGMSVLFATEEVDKGDIIIQKKAPIDDSMYIKEIISVQSGLYVEACIELLDKLKTNSIEAQPQEESNATYSIWRNPEDCQIDWNLSNVEIYNLIRAVSEPYTGAFSYFDANKVYIWKAEKVKDIKFEKRDCGKIWRIDDGNPIVVCGQGMLKLLDVTDGNRNPVVFTSLRKRFKSVG